MNLSFLKSYSSKSEAEMAQNLLRQHKIESVVQASRQGTTGYLGDLSGGELYVRISDLDKAKQLLEEWKYY